MLAAIMRAGRISPRLRDFPFCLTQPLIRMFSYTAFWSARWRQIGQGTCEVKWFVIKAPVRFERRGGEGHKCVRDYPHWKSEAQSRRELREEGEECFKSDGAWRAGKSNYGIGATPQPKWRLLNASMHHQQKRQCPTLASPPKAKNQNSALHPSIVFVSDIYWLSSSLLSAVMSHQQNTWLPSRHLLLEPILVWSYKGPILYASAAILKNLW